MMKVRLDPSVTYGNLLQTLVLAGGIVGAWFHMKSTVDSHTERIAAQERAIRQTQQTDIKLAETTTKLSENLQVLTAIVEERTGSKTPTFKR